jgi:hypothetical protein
MYALQPTNGDRLRIADCGLRIIAVKSANSVTGQTVRRLSVSTPTGAKTQPACANPQSAIRNPKSRGLSLIEVVASTFIVALMAVAALNTLGAATRSSESVGNRAVAMGLADELMAEILQAPYSDPSQTPVFGLEGGEPASPRSAFDDVDDYDNWSETPPKYRDGTTMPDRADWRHRVRVSRVTPGDLTQVSGTDQGAKRIRVTIEYRGEVLADQYAIRTNTDEK